MSAPKDDQQKQRRHSPEPDRPQTEVREIGGPKGPEPTRYNDWERNGKCVDF